MFPSDDILLARGKYSTLGKERREQLERVQKVVDTIMTNAQQALRDCEKRPPENPGPLETMKRCIENLTVARDRLGQIGIEMNELQSVAWGEGE